MSIFVRNENRQPCFTVSLFANWNRDENRQSLHTVYSLRRVLIHHEAYDFMEYEIPVSVYMMIVYWLAKQTRADKYKWTNKSYQDQIQA